MPFYASIQLPWPLVRHGVKMVSSSQNLAVESITRKRQNFRLHFAFLLRTLIEWTRVFGWAHNNNNVAQNLSVRITRKRHAFFLRGVLWSSCLGDGHWSRQLPLGWHGMVSSSQNLAVESITRKRQNFRLHFAFLLRTLIEWTLGMGIAPHFRIAIYCDTKNVLRYVLRYIVVFHKLNFHVLQSWQNEKKRRIQKFINNNKSVKV